MDLTSITMNLAIAKRDLKYQSLSFALSVFLRRLIERSFETMAEITQRIKTDLIGNLASGNGCDLPVPAFDTSSR